MSNIINDIKKELTKSPLRQGHTLLETDRNRVLVEYFYQLLTNHRWDPFFDDKFFKVRVNESYANYEFKLGVKMYSSYDIAILSMSRHHVFLPLNYLDLLNVIYNAVGEKYPSEFLYLLKFLSYKHV